MTERQGETGLVIQDLVYAGLDALGAATSLDLCAFLHAAGDLGPQLYLARPSLAEMDATEAFNLFTALRDTSEDEHDGDEIILLGGYLALAVTTRGRYSRGLHVIGRRDGSLDEHERELAVKLCRSFGRAAHALESAPDRPRTAAAPARVAVELVGDLTRAEVAVPIGGEVRTGTAEAPAAPRAVALAVIDAVDQSLKLGEAIEGEIGTERAVLVLLTDERGRSILGASLCGAGADPLQATAAAALDAASRLLDAKA
ncbi:MAG: hypothetical protein L0221_09855 [Chloroflexi bacterium]|nr:hypothetical protein [Chloroflexota bacterium]